jgi:argininosuccinate lyase
MVVERGIVPPALGARIAAAIAAVIEAGGHPGAQRPGDYLAVETALIEAGGPEVTRVHSGRSRQDITATFGRLFLREGLLDALESLDHMRERLLVLARSHRDAVVPAYTWGVQAQPTTLGHWLGAYAAGFARAAERHRQAYARVALCPLGSAALGTSSFPVDRPRLAELLGFEGVEENSLDATQLAPADLRAETSQLVATSALTVGMLLADLTQQYSHTRPWLTLDPGQQTGVSSIMPQKRNPTGIVRLRALASRLVGSAGIVALQAHNVSAGMHDYKLDGPDPILRDAARMHEELEAVLAAIRFDPERALDEVNAEYSTTTELADVLQRDADVPFRAGHHFASELVTYGRAQRLRPAELPHHEVRRLYAAAAADFELDPQLPLSEAEFRRALSAEGMIAASQGLGGPQPAEVARMLAQQREALDADRSWTRGVRERLALAAQRRDAAFSALSSPAPRS